MTIEQQIKWLNEEIIALRRHFHRYPEASLKEYETAKKIIEELEQHCIDYVRVGETGVLAKIQGGHKGKKVLLRVDIDALEITEKTAVDYASVNDGLCHACGHDAHIAMGLGTAFILQANKHLFKGTAYIAFQQAEEIGAGAKQFIQSGLIDDVDESFAIHVRSDLPINYLAVRGGAVNASCDIFKIKITGKSAHVGESHKGIDALVTASEVVMGLQTIVSRRLSPVDNAVVGIGKFNAGSRYNIVANEAVLEGTIRAFSHETRALLKTSIECLVNGICQGHRCDVSFEWYDAAAPVINDTILANRVVEIANKIDDISQVVTDYDVSLGADDFADYQVNKPGVYILLGSQSGADTAFGHHHEQFNIDERVLLTGIQYEVNYFLNRLQD